MIKGECERGVHRGRSGRTARQTLGLDYLTTDDPVTGDLFGGRRRGVVFGAQECDKLRNLLIAQGIAKGRHLLSAAEDLIGHFGGGPVLVVADLSEGRRFFGSLEVGPMAVGTSLVAEEGSTGFDIGWGVGCERGGGGEKQ
jgi:hypothetical protein